MCINDFFLFQLQMLTLYNSRSAAHGQDEFNTYIIPEKEITPGASQVTQLAVVRVRLCLRGKPVD